MKKISMVIAILSQLTVAWFSQSANAAPDEDTDSSDVGAGGEHSEVGMAAGGGTASVQPQGDGGGEYLPENPTSPYLYLPDAWGGSARGTFINPGEGGPVLTLEVKNIQTPGSLEGIYQASQIWEVRICKSNADAVPSFKYDHEWMVQNREGSLPSRVFADMSGNQCGDWQKINLSALHCGSNALQAQVWSPEECNSSNCTYRTGAVIVQKICFQ